MVRGAERPRGGSAAAACRQQVTAMATSIAANAWVDPRAEIDEEVEIGPFCMIGPTCAIGRGTRLLNNVTLMGNVTLGCDNVLFPNVVIGADPQDISYQGSDTRVEIGDGNTSFAKA